MDMEQLREIFALKEKSETAKGITTIAVKVNTAKWHEVKALCGKPFARNTDFIRELVVEHLLNK